MTGMFFSFSDSAGTSQMYEYDFQVSAQNQFSFYFMLFYLFCLFTSISSIHFLNQWPRRRREMR